MPGAAPPRCAFCDGLDLGQIMDFGDVALAGGFLRQDQFAAERKYRLRVHFCRTCFAVQVVDYVPAEVLFTDYFYFSSSIGTLRDHFKAYAKELTQRFLTEPKAAAVLEFGCNDGVLLRPLADNGIGKVLGVDPATNVVATIADPRVTVVNDFFNEAVAEKIVAEHGEIDMVMANNVYAHIPDIQVVTRAVHRVLKPDGVFVFEVHYLGKVVDEMQYDMIYHEHLYYYSLLALENHLGRHGMKVFDIKRIPIHGGSIRFYACRAESTHAKSVTNRVLLLRQDEAELGLGRVETFKHFAAEIAERKDTLMDYLGRLRKQGKRVAGYGASGRANTIIQYCGIDAGHMEYMIDDAPAKWGYYTPGSHFEIRSADVLEKDPPDHLVVFAWAYLNEIAEKRKRYLDGGGRLITPLPEVRELSHVKGMRE
jgi:methylation protein EvaC